MWILLLSMAFAGGGGAMTTSDFASKEMCVEAAEAFAHANPGQVKWVCAPHLRGGSTGERPVSGK
jgi:hypothetical protein